MEYVVMYSNNSIVKRRKKENLRAVEEGGVWRITECSERMNSRKEDSVASFASGSFLRMYAMRKVSNSRIC